ncbi:hypothetical protein [Nocardia sp. NPDC050710]|uniref:hypothetical protein n=1 Tax=Nocardia sp. NPDC050710 TaxID=3157220 RepID=UPI0033E93484
MGWWNRLLPWRSGTPDAPRPNVHARSQDWREMPPVQRAVAAPTLVTAPARFAEELVSHRDPSFHSPVGHAVSAAAPSGVVTGLDRDPRPVQRFRDETPGGDAPHEQAHTPTPSVSLVSVARQEAAATEMISAARVFEPEVRHFPALPPLSASVAHAPTMQTTQASAPHPSPIPVPAEPVRPGPGTDTPTAQRATDPGDITDADPNGGSIVDESPADIPPTASEAPAESAPSDTRPDHEFHTTAPSAEEPVRPTLSSPTIGLPGSVQRAVADTPTRPRRYGLGAPLPDHSGTESPTASSPFIQRTAESVRPAPSIPAQLPTMVPTPIPAPMVQRTAEADRSTPSTPAQLPTPLPAPAIQRSADNVRPTSPTPAQIPIPSPAPMVHPTADHVRPTSPTPAQIPTPVPAPVVQRTDVVTAPIAPSLPTAAYPDDFAHREAGGRDADSAPSVTIPTDSGHPDPTEEIARVSDVEFDEPGQLPTESERSVPTLGPIDTSVPIAAAVPASTGQPNPAPSSFSATAPVQRRFAAPASPPSAREITAQRATTASNSPLASTYTPGIAVNRLAPTPAGVSNPAQPTPPVTEPPNITGMGSVELTRAVGLMAAPTALQRNALHSISVVQRQYPADRTISAPSAVAALPLPRPSSVLTAATSNPPVAQRAVEPFGGTADFANPAAATLIADRDPIGQPSVGITAPAWPPMRVQRATPPAATPHPGDAPAAFTPLGQVFSSEITVERTEPTLTVARETEPAPPQAAPAAEPTTVSTSTAATGGHPANPATGSSPTDVDALVGRLYEPIVRKLKAELRLDRERAGTGLDLTL